MPPGETAEVRSSSASILRRVCEVDALLRQRWIKFSYRQARRHLGLVGFGGTVDLVIIAYLDAFDPGGEPSIAASIRLELIGSASLVKQSTGRRRRELSRVSDRLDPANAQRQLSTGSAPR